MSQITSGRNLSLVQLGGGLGIAACFIGLAIFLAACCGFNAVFMLSIIPLALGGIGFILSIVGPLVQKSIHVEDSAVFAAIFLGLLGIVGSLMLMSAWLGWQILPGGTVK
ncbi:MAG TPA: hypothetical protein VHS31_06055 [Tepidisphaeraceae bacterium]|jgi:hypothetical protein|nr:hypothetical protein [Tepidisphaeraceae bacterium]